MLMNPTRLLFLFTLMFGTLISISATSWFGAWMGLEINLLSFIPLMSNNNRFSAEAALKYFLVQALASAILLFAALINYLSYSSMVTSNLFYSPHLFMSTTLLLKMGAAPFHFWFPGVMEGLSWNCNMLLMTWQKVAPLMLLSYLILSNMFFNFILLLSILAGSLGGFNQTSLRKIMAYSSINHLGWMIAALLMGDTYWLVYFSFYSFLSLTVVILFNFFQLSHLNQIFSMGTRSSLPKLFMFLNLLSLGGLPPFLGFFPKWMIIQAMVNNYSYTMISLMVTLTLITLFFYLRLAYSAFMLTHSEPKWFYYYNNLPPLMMLMLTMSLLGLPLSCLIMFMF